jgi:hypothetical protein
MNVAVHGLRKRTPSLALLAASTLAAALTLTAQEPDKNQGTPQLFCAEPVYNFGTMSDQKTVAHTFILENRGDAELMLLSVRTTCGCTTAEFSQKTIPPGGKAELRTEFVLKGRRGEETKKAYVRTNDPKKPTMGFTLTGVVQRTFSLEPPKLTFRPKSRDKEDQWTAQVDLAIEHDTPWQITKLVPSDPVFFTVRIVKQQDNEAQLQVTLDKDFFIAENSAKGSLTIHTTHPEYHVLSLPIRVYAPAVVRIIPSSLDSQSRRGGPPSKEQTVLLRSELPDSVELIDVEVPDGLTSTVQVLRHYIIRVDGFGEDSTALEGKSVRIRARIEGKEQVFTVPIEGND